jgi:hypothetical protein
MIQLDIASSRSKVLEHRQQPRSGKSFAHRLLRMSRDLEGVVERRVSYRDVLTEHPLQEAG